MSKFITDKGTLSTSLAKYPDLEELLKIIASENELNERAISFEEDKIVVKKELYDTIKKRESKFADLRNLLGDTLLEMVEKNIPELIIRKEGY